MAIDISDLPPPPLEENKLSPSVDISDLPPPPQASQVDISDLPISENKQYYQKLKKEMSAYGPIDLVTEEAAAARGGRLLTKVTSDKDINALAEEHGVDPNELRKLAPYNMALPQDMSFTDFLKRVAGGVGYGVAGDIPQWLFKKTQDPNMRAALDDLKQLSEGRLGAIEFLGWNLIPTGRAVKALTIPEKVLPTLAKGVATGAAFGIAGSREGEELEQAALGAATGGALAEIALGGKKLLRKVGIGEVVPAVTKEGEKFSQKVDDGTLKISEEYAKNNELRLSEITDKAWSSIEQSEKDIAEAVIKKVELSDDQVDRIISDQLTPESVALSKETLAKKLDKEVNEVTDRDIVNELVQQRREAFGERLAKEIPAYREPVKEGEALRAPTVDEIYARASGQGEERLYNKFLGEAYVNTGLQQISKLHVQSSPDAAPLGKLLVNTLSDRQFVLKTIDEVKGTNLLSHFYDLVSNYNRFTMEKSVKEKEISSVFRTIRKADLLPDATKTTDFGGELFQKMDNNLDNELTGEARDIALTIRSFFDSVVDRGNTIQGNGITPLNITKRKDFGVPNMTVDPTTYVINVKKQAGMVDSILKERIGMGIENLTTKEDLDKALRTSPEFRDLNSAIKLVSNIPVVDGESFRAAYKEATQRGASNPRLYSVASTTLKREEKIPDFVREKNLLKIMKRYSENTLRNVYMREPLEQLANQARLLRAAKDIAGAEYVERLVADNLGIRAHSMARVGNEARIKFAEVVDKGLTALIPNEARRKNVVDAFRLLPEMMANIQYNIYPNVLGMNPKAHLAQLTQTWFKTAPEVGGIYGYELTSKAFLRSAFALRGKEPFREFYGKVKKYGLEPEGFVREGQEFLADNIERNILYNTGAKAIRTASEVFMYTYGKMDTFNRATTAYMAEKLVEDLNSGVKGAFNAVNKMPSSIRRELVKNKGNLEGQAAIIAKHLNSTTQFNYNRAAMSEIGIILGPFFSTFTKWPLATAGDIIADLRTKGIQSGGIRAAEKYGATLLLASVMDNAIRLSLSGEADIGGDFKDYDDRVKKFIGTSGFAGMTPITSAAALLPSDREKSIFTPPVIDAFYKGILSPMMGGDTERALEQGSKAVKTFIPGGFIYRFLMEDIPTYATGEKPR